MMKHTIISVKKPFHKLTILLIVLLMVTSGFAEGPKELCQVAGKSLIHVSDIRKLNKRKSVPCKVRNKEEIRSFILESVEKKLPKDKLKFEEVVFKALGFIGKDYDYEKGLIDLYASQVSGFYDPEAKEFVMASWIPAILQVPVAVHELTHALQDQHFNLEKLIDPNSASTDELLARTALIEGDATAVMMDHARVEAGQQGLVSLVSVDSILMQNVLGFSLVAGSLNAPRALQLLIMFPYSSGLRFVHSLLRKGGYTAVDSAYRKLPLTTREILHPEIYPLDEKIQVPAEAFEDLKKEGEFVYQDSLGEFFISALFLSHAEKNSAKIAEGLIADKVVVIEKKDGDYGVSWWTRWKSKEDLRDFRKFSELIEKLHGKEQSGIKSNESENSLRFDLFL